MKLIWARSILFILVIGLLAGAPLLGSAQAIEQWSVARQIPDYDSIARAPYLVADHNATVHAFSYETISGSLSAIFYRRWTAESGWSPKVDVLIPTLGSGTQTIQGVFLDETGVIHLIYANFTDTGGEIYYSHALASQADRATAWSAPEVIGPSAGPLPFAALTGDAQGRLVMLYGSKQAGSGLYEAHSLDGGLTWSAPRLVSLYLNRTQWPASIRMDFDDQGRLHAVWGVVNAAGTGDEVRYARLEADFSAWTLETVLAKREGNDYSTTWPDIISSGDLLMVIYQDSFPATRYMRISRDGGQTWSLAVRPFPEIGEYENAILLKDNQGNIHMVLGDRTVDPEIHGMWYSRWLGRSWTPLKAITSGPVTSSYDPSAPQAVMVQGNLILAVWWHNVRRDLLSGAWYAYTYLDLTPDSRTPLPQATEVPTETPSAAEHTPQSALTPSPQINPRSAGDQNPAIPIMAGLVPVVIGLPLVLIFLRRKSNRY